MDIYLLITGNKELLKVFYSLIVVLICLTIVVKTHKLFRISMHNGIRYFRNAFFFYGIGFSIRYFVGAPIFYNGFFQPYFFLLNPIFEFFLIMAGFFLVYSLVWKRFEKEDSPYSSLFNSKISVFYLMGFILVFLDYMWGTLNFMFISQILIFAFASIISYNNYRKKQTSRRFLKFYFIAMIMSLIAWTLNFLAALLFNWNQIILMNIYILNLLVFLLFLYGVIKVAR